jgi:hypothetical protein
MVIFLTAKNWRMRRNVWHWALSWCSTNPFFHFFGRFLRTSFRRRCSRPLYYSEFTMVPRGTNSSRTVPSVSKKTINMAFTFDFDRRAFFALGQFGLFQWELRIFFPGSQAYTQDSSPMNRLLTNHQHEFARSFNSNNVHKWNSLCSSDKRCIHMQWASHSDSRIVIHLHVGDQSLWAFTITHSWSWALLEKPPIVQLLKNFTVFYGTRRFITVFTRALHWSLSWADRKSVV